MAAQPAVRESRRVLIVDDEPIMAALLSTALEAGGFQTHSCTTAREARAAIADFDPDAAVLDVSLGRGPSGIDLAHIFDQKHPGIAVLLLTKHSDLRAAGHSRNDIPKNCGLLRKESLSDTRELITALESLLREQATRTQDESSGPLATLTTQQIAVLRMVTQGYTTPAIARIRGTSVSAVEKMLAAVYVNLGLDASGDVSPRAEAMRIFIAASGVPERP